MAAVAEAAALPFPFTLTARTECFLRGNPNLDDVIKRLQVGADVLMAPGLPDLAAVRAVCSAVPKPINFMAGIKGSRSRSPSSKRSPSPFADHHEWCPVLWMGEAAPGLAERQHGAA